MIKHPLFESSLVRLAEFIHPPNDDTWASPQAVHSDVPLVVFPRTSVEIRFANEPPFLTSPNHAMFYNPDTVYSRHAVGQRGDEYVEFQLGRSTIEALESEDRGVRDGRLMRHHAAAAGPVYMHQYLLARHLKTGGDEPLLVEGTAMRILRAVIKPPASSRSQRPSTRAQHRELAEEAKRLLAANLGAPLTLSELARELRCSPFHLERLFRRETGYTLHAYRTQLRLRAALERLPAAAGDLAALACELGFASHSHFTTAFGRTFGLPPSAVKDPRKVRRHLKATERLLACS